MNIKNYLDSTYLKTAEQAGVSEEENVQINKNAIQEAIDFDFKLIMLRPNMVSLAKKMIEHAKSKVTIGTVIDFPLGQNDTDYKLNEAQNAIDNGADDLDFVLDYEAFKRGEIDKIKEQIIKCTQLGLTHQKIVKWIIEVAALSDGEIIKISSLIKNCIVANFKEDVYENVYVKSSTGFYKTESNKPNGATIHAIKLMIENAFPLSIKAAGGVRNYNEAIEMIALGVKRIGTSAAKSIVEGKNAQSNY